MGAAKATLIVVGTIGGLGAVLAYQPPHKSLILGGNLGGNTGTNLGGTPTSTQSSAEIPTSTPTPATSETPTASPPKTTPTPTHAKPVTKPVAKPVTKPVPKTTPPKKTTPPAPALINGTFNGSTSQTAYGPVQVQIDVKNSKIVAARALQLPTSTPRDQEINAQAIPILVSETIAASSADIQGVSGASYTSQGWYDSLVSAISNAGL